MALTNSFLVQVDREPLVYAVFEKKAELNSYDELKPDNLTNNPSRFVELLGDSVEILTIEGDTYTYKLKDDETLYIIRPFRPYYFSVDVDRHMKLEL